MAYAIDLWKIVLDSNCSKETRINIKNGLNELNAKAKAFDEIVIETTGAIMNCPPGVVETEAGKLTLDIIDKYEKQMEDK